MPDGSRDKDCGMAFDLRTPSFGIEYPIFNVGFAESAGSELVVAVCDAEGGGVLGASGVPAGEIRRLAARVRELTNRPFGVNII
jgi:NAD(P)H-dependent flavin oxidoreductase YrpB (nitropropane dioxygenase family)